jgi:myosin-5
MKLYGWFVDAKSTDLCVPCSYDDGSENSVTVTLLSGENEGAEVVASKAPTSGTAAVPRGPVLLPYGTEPFRPVADLIRMAALTEETLLHNLRERYQADEIYTCIGDIVVAVNPYKQLRL